MESHFLPWSWYSDDAVGCLQEEINRANNRLCCLNAAAVCAFWNSLYLSEGDVCRQRGEHTLTWTTLAVFMPSAVGGVLKLTASVATKFLAMAAPMWP